MRAEGLNIQRRQYFTALGASGNRQLMLAQVRQFAVEPVVTARAQPLGGVVPVAGLRAEVELDRQFQVMHAVAVAQQHVQFTQGVPLAANRQVGGNQFYAGCMLHGELPEAFVIQAQAPGPGLGQPVQQAIAVPIQLPQPMLQPIRCLHPVAAGQRVALRPRGFVQHGRREDDPRQVTHFGMA